MPVKLIDSPAEPREVRLGEGVSVTILPIGYAEYNAAQAEAANRALLAIDWNPEDGADALPRRAYLGALETALLDVLVERYATGWDGVYLANGEPAELNAATWRNFRDLRPTLARELALEFAAPAGSYLAEGNA